MIETIATYRAHGGHQGLYRHQSRATGTPMDFAVFIPDRPKNRNLPVIWYLSGLTCTPMNVVEKGEFRQACSETGIAFVCPDTSPRGDTVPDDEAYDFGQGAGFYLDATKAPYSDHYQMYSYIVDELPSLIGQNFPVDMSCQSIMGHSMGGHGALTIGLKNASAFRSISAFSPICAPSLVPWGRQAFSRYLGAGDETTESWRCYDTVALVHDGAKHDHILVDQGRDDQFLKTQLKTDTLVSACKKAGLKADINFREGYDHSYYFISTFMADHIHWHAKRLG